MSTDKTVESEDPSNRLSQNNNLSEIVAASTACIVFYRKIQFSGLSDSIIKMILSWQIKIWASLQSTAVGLCALSSVKRKH